MPFESDIGKTEADDEILLLISIHIKKKPLFKENLKRKFRMKDMTSESGIKYE